MIGRRLEGDVERDVEPEVGRGVDESIEVVERTESGFDGRMTAFILDGSWLPPFLSLKEGVFLRAA